ncbi:MAG: GxxExxY protein [Planctomycetota bacterium]
MNLVEKQLAEKIIGACMEVSNELGCGFLEGVCEKALLIALRDKGLKAEAQVPLVVKFRNKAVGEFFADIVVADAVLLELKATRNIAPEHEAQLLNYLEASGHAVGLLVNFGRPKLEWKRFVS